MRPWTLPVLALLALGGCHDGTGALPVLHAHAEQVMLTGGYRFVAVPYSREAPPNQLTVDSGNAVLDLVHDRFSMRLRGVLGSTAWAYTDSGSLGPQTPWHGDSTAYLTPSAGLVAQIYVAPDETVLMLFPGSIYPVSKAVFGP